MVRTNRNTCFMSFQITDKDLLYNIRECLGSNHVIKEITYSKKWKTGYRLQIGSKCMFADLQKLGMFQGKSKRMQFPKVPQKYLRDFIRGYFDGDGCVLFSTYYAKDRDKMRKVFMSTFSSGSKLFLQQLKEVLHKEGVVSGGSLYAKSRGNQLSFSYHDSVNLFNFMYSSVSEGDIFLKRKYQSFRTAVQEMYGEKYLPPCIISNDV